MEHFLPGYVDPNYDPCSPDPVPIPHPSPCQLREVVNRALAIPKIWQLSLGTDAVGPPSQDDCGQTATWTRDVSVLVFVTISLIGVGPVPLTTKSKPGW